MKQVTVYLDARQQAFLVDHCKRSGQNVSQAVRYALNKLDAEFKFQNREFNEPMQLEGPP